MRDAALRGKAPATMEQLWGNLGGTMGQLTTTTPLMQGQATMPIACSPSSASSTKLRDWGKGGKGCNNYGKFSRLDATSHQHTLLQGQILPSHVLLHLQVHCREERLKRELGGRIMRKSSRHFGRPSWHSLTLSCPISCTFNNNSWMCRNSWRWKKNYWKVESPQCSSDHHPSKFFCIYHMMKNSPCYDWIWFRLHKVFIAVKLYFGT